MTVLEIQRHIDYLQRLYAELADPMEKAAVLDDLIFYRQLLREATA
jgi:hypothetical protein